MAEHRLVVTCPSDTSRGAGVLTVLGGKSSCRRKFGMTVHLVDSTGRLVPRDLILHAAVVYHHDHAPVLRGENAAESPCFSTFNGIEFPASDKPTRMIEGRASFKLALSLLSSKCDNSLFAIQFSAQYAPGAEQLLPLPECAYSGPIRSISRKRNRAQGAGGSNPGCLPAGLLELPSLTSPASSCELEQGAPAAKRPKQEAQGEAQSAGQMSSQPGPPGLTSQATGSNTQRIAPGATEGRHPGNAAPYNEAGTAPQYPAHVRPTPVTTNVTDMLETGPGTPPVTFADLANLLTQSGAFATGGSAGVRPASGGQNRPSPSTGPPSTWTRGNPGEQESLASPMTPFSLDNLNQATAAAAAQKMAAVTGRSFDGSGEVAGPAGMEQRSLDDEERTLQYMEASLAEVTLELLRRREELSVRRRRFVEHEQRMKSMALHSHMLWSCTPAGQ